MTITVDATFENGQFKLKGPVALAEGTPVRLSITPLVEHGNEIQDPLAGVIGVGDGPSDGADNHDKYIYGKMRS